MNPEEIKEFLKKCAQLFRIEQKIRERRNRIYYKKKLLRTVYRDPNEILGQAAALQSCIDREKEVIVILKRNRRQIESTLSSALVTITQLEKIKDKEIRKLLGRKPTKIRILFEEMGPQLEKTYTNTIPSRERRIALEEEFLQEQNDEVLRQVIQMLKDEEREYKRMQRWILNWSSKAWVNFTIVMHVLLGTSALQTLWLETYRDVHHVYEDYVLITREINAESVVPVVMVTLTYSLFCFVLTQLNRKAAELATQKTLST